MPIVQDHPLRLLRIRAGLSQGEVARRAGVTRSAVAQLEEGRITKPNEKIVGVLSAQTGTPAAKIVEDVALWHTTLATPLSRRAEMALSLPASIVDQYADYEQWRSDIAENVTQLSSLLRVSRNTIVAYEEGRSRAMPKPMIAALQNQLGLSDEYVSAVTRLPRRSLKEAEAATEAAAETNEEAAPTDD